MKYQSRTTTAFIVSLITALLPLISSGDSSHTLVGSCNNVSSGFCNEFTGSSYKTPTVQRTCEKQKMVFLSGACPVENRVGSCLVYTGQMYESSYRYYDKFPGTHSTSGQAAAAAEKQCTSLKGVWTLN